MLLNIEIKDNNVFYSHIFLVFDLTFSVTLSTLIHKYYFT